MVIVDEAYSDFSPQQPFRFELPKHPNLIVLNTMSKAWALAAIRLGMAFASKEIIDLFNKVKYPYNVNLLTQQQALKVLEDPFEVDKCVKLLLQERTRMIEAFRLLPICEKGLSHRCQLLPGQASPMPSASTTIWSTEASSCATATASSSATTVCALPSARRARTTNCFPRYANTNKHRHNKKASSL